MNDETPSGAADLMALLQAAMAGLGHLASAQTSTDKPGQPGHDSRMGQSSPTPGQGSPTPGQAGRLPTTCGVCPICLGIATISRTHPQVLVHLSEAATALAAAAAALTHPTQPDEAPAQGASTARPRPADQQHAPASDRVQHIAVDE